MEKKKVYLKPQLELVEVELTNCIAASVRIGEDSRAIEYKKQISIGNIGNGTPLTDHGSYWDSNF